MIQDVNTFLHGGTAYFRVGNSARMFDKVEEYAVSRVLGIIATRHRQRTR